MEKTANLNFTKGDAKEEAIVKEIDYLYEKVARQLDALSHFHFTPKPLVKEPTFKALDVSSLAKEEVAPAFLNLASTAAPEEHKEKRLGRNSAFITEADVGRDDRKRLRRATKAANKKAKLAENGGYSTKSKDDNLNLDRRVVTGRESIGSSEDFTKSSKFFSNMQNQIEMEKNEKIAIAGGNKRKKSRKEGFTGGSGAGFKL